MLKRDYENARFVAILGNRHCKEVEKGVKEILKRTLK
jgi:hypothetical protein